MKRWGQLQAAGGDGEPALGGRRAKMADGGVPPPWGGGGVLWAGYFHIIAGADGLEAGVAAGQRLPPRPCPEWVLGSTLNSRRHAVVGSSHPHVPRGGAEAP